MVIHRESKKETREDGIIVLGEKFGREAQNGRRHVTETGHMLCMQPAL